MRALTLNRSYLTRKLDKAFSEFIRSAGKCQRCSSTEHLQTSHIFSRTYRSVRWDCMNAFCLCAKCHWYFHLNPIEHAEFAKFMLGEKQYEDLRRYAKRIKKWSIEEMQEHYKTLKKLLERRVG